MRNLSSTAPHFAERRIIVMGATSGLGRALAERFLMAGWRIGAAGRNTAALQALRALAPGRVVTAQIDICAIDAPSRLAGLIEELGEVDIYLHCSGILKESDSLDLDAQTQTVATNAEGFARMVGAAFEYFRTTGRRGRIVAISSIAGFRGLGDLPAYSASKAFDQAYLEALRQRADALHLPLHIVDIRPGWTRTPLLDASRRYLFEMKADRVADLIYRATLHAKRTATIGLRWRLLTLLERLTPAPIWQRLHLPLWRP